MAFALETHVLPVLQDMVTDPLADDYPIQSRMRELGVADSDDKADRLMELMRADGYILKGQQSGSGAWPIVFDVRLTPEAFKQLDVWPDDNERGLYLLRRIADAFDEVAEDADETGLEHERAGKLRIAAQSVRQVVRRGRRRSRRQDHLQHRHWR